MKGTFKKPLATVLAVVTAASLTPSVGLLSANVSAFAASASVKAAKTSIAAKKANTITVKGVAAKNYVKLAVTGSAKKGVTLSKKALTGRQNIL